MSDDFRLYAGDGTTIAERGMTLPLFEAPLEDPAGYLAEPGLRDAVNVAVTLGQPLLITGEPGSGKTTLAASVAHELNLGRPFVFHTKTTSIARDLFYRYDALLHFHEAQFGAAPAGGNGSDPGAPGPVPPGRDAAVPGQRPAPPSAEKHIHYEALGLAILLAMDPRDANPFLEPDLRDRGPARSVVLVDEIDKAPRDLPNDVLHEIEHMSFTVWETGRTFRADERYRPILILTSNSEKSLPEAFTRRCAFYHLAPPNRERLMRIVSARVPTDSRFSPEMLAHAVDRFLEIRELSLKKKPATAEFLSWVRILAKMEVDVADVKPGQAEVIALSYSILAKDKDDLERLKDARAGTRG